MEIPSQSPQVSPNSLASLITSYVKRVIHTDHFDAIFHLRTLQIDANTTRIHEGFSLRGTQEAEVRAHKALSILHARDRQVDELQRRISELEGAAGRLLQVEVPLLRLPPSPEEPVSSPSHCNCSCHSEDNGDIMVPYLCSSGSDNLSTAPAHMNTQAVHQLLFVPMHPGKTDAKLPTLPCHLPSDANITRPSVPQSAPFWPQMYGSISCEAISTISEPMSDITSSSITENLLDVLDVSQSSVSPSILPELPFQKSQMADNYQIIGDNRTSVKDIAVQTSSEPAKHLQTALCVVSPQQGVPPTESEPEEMHARCHEVIDELKRYNNQLRTALEGTEVTRKQSRTEYAAILNRVQDIMENVKPLEIMTQCQSSQTELEIKCETSTQTDKSEILTSSMYTQTEMIEVTSTSMQTENEWVNMEEKIEELRLKYEEQKYAYNDLMKNYTELKNNFEELRNQKHKQEKDFKTLLEQKPEMLDKFLRRERTSPRADDDHSTDEDEYASRNRQYKTERCISVVTVCNIATQTQMDFDSDGSSSSISDVPPQWLLEAALRRPHYCKRRVIETIIEENQSDGEKYVGIVRPVLSRAIQVDLGKENEQELEKRIIDKDEQITRQEEAINALTERLHQHGLHLRQLGEAAAIELENERHKNKTFAEMMDIKMTQICHSVVTKFGLPISPIDLLEIHYGDEDDNSEDDMNGYNEGGDHCKSPLLRSSSDTNVENMLNHLNGLRARLNSLKTNIIRADRTTRHKYPYNEFFQKALIKILEEVEVLHRQLEETKTDNDRAMNRTHDSSSKSPPAERKNSKQSENTRMQSIQSRLRTASQNIITLNKTLNTLKQEAEVAQNTIASLKSRLSRSEATNQNRMLLIEKYKLKLSSAEQIAAFTTNNTSVTKDIILNLRSQIANLKTQNTKMTSQKNEYMEQLRKLKHNRNMEVGRVDLESRIKNDAMHLQVQEVRKCYLQQVSEVEKTANDSLRKVKEFMSTVEIFLTLVQKHCASVGSNGDCERERGLRREAEAIACNILNLSRTEMQSLIAEVNETGCTHSQEMMEWMNYYQKLVSSETFSQHLAEFLFKVVLTHFEPETNDDE